MKRPRPKYCVYCRTGAKDSKDHVPPRGIFGKDRTGLQLITVPCCQSCKTGELGDAALMALLGLGIERHPSVSRVAENAHEQLNEGSWWLNELRASAAGVKRIVLPSGRIADQWILTPELTAEVSKTIVRTAIGLISKHDLEWDHRDYEFVVRQRAENRIAEIREIDGWMDMLKLPHRVTIGSGHFEARWGFPEDQLRRGVMQMRFYENYAFYVAAYPIGSVPDEMRVFISSWR